LLLASEGPEPGPTIMDRYLNGGIAGKGVLAAITPPT
jgi:hypothetical protein